MGWRSALRSYNTATRANQQRTNRAERIISRHDASVDRLTSDFDEESIKDLKKVEAFEEKLAERPISFGQVDYHPEVERWSFRELSDETGQITFNMRLSIRDSPVTFEPSSLELPDRHVEFVAAAFSRHGIFIAVKVTPRPSATKAIKLIYKTTPAKNRIMLEDSEGMQVLPVESNIDDPVVHEDRNLRMVVFPLGCRRADDGSVETVLLGRWIPVHCHWSCGSCGPGD